MTRLPLRLEHAIDAIAAHYRRQVRLRGLLRFGGAFLVLLAGLGVAVWAPGKMPMVLPFGAFAVLVVLAGYRWLYRPCTRAFSHREIARFLDAHHPELEDLVLSSVALSETGGMGASAWMVDQVLARARTLRTEVRLPDLVDAGALGRLRRVAAGVMGLGVLGAALLLVLVDWHAVGRRFFFAPQAISVPFSVEPGNVRVRRGATQMVWVTTDRKGAHKAIQWRAGNGDWQTGELEPGQADGVYAFRLRDLMEDTDYQVQVGAFRSVVYRISVWTPPEVVSIGLTYRYPDYLQMPARTVLHGGDIAAPEGTVVVLDVAVNKAMEKAELALDSGAHVALERTDSTLWRGQLTVSGNDQYAVALRDAGGEENAYPQHYKIAAQKDKAPEVRIRFPRGDDEATALEEVPFGVRVKDDFGLTDYGFQYAVAGRDPVRVSLKKGTGRVDQAEGEYMLSLDKLHVSPGDFVTWTFWATDGKPGRSAAEGLGDPYFLEIRPFERLFREAVSNEGGQQGSAGNQGPEVDEKQIMIATWNLRKTAPGLSSEEFAKQLQTIVAAQRTVQASALNGTMQDGAVDPALLSGLTGEIRDALEALGSAALPEPDAALARAMGHEQMAYHFLLRMTPVEREVAQARGMQGGGRGAQQRELDGLEIARRRDFREEASTLQTQLAETQQAHNKIEDLARRQAAINEDIARLISEMEKMNDSEREAAKRRLAQLQEAQQRTMSALDEVSGEIASGDMASDQSRQARGRLDEARQQMDRSARNMAGSDLQHARAAGSQALNALRDVQQQLTHLSRDAAAARMRGLQAAMDSIGAQQAQITAAAGARENTRGRPSLAEGAQDQDLAAQQDSLAEAFKRFMDDASALADKATESQGLMAQKLGDWLRQTSREGIYEEMQAGKDPAQRGDWNAAAAHGAAASAKLDSASARLSAVAQAMVHDDLDAMEKALSRIEGVLPKDDGTPWRPGEARQFAAEGYRGWMDALREAESLLPDGSEVGRRLSGVREGLWGIGQRYHRDAAAPQYDLIYETAIKPLKLAAEDLRQAIRNQREAFGLSAGESDAVPEAYRSRVADYFKALAELDEKK